MVAIMTVTSAEIEEAMKDLKDVPQQVMTEGEFYTKMIEAGELKFTPHQEVMAKIELMLEKFEEMEKNNEFQLLPELE